MKKSANLKQDGQIMLNISTGCRLLDIKKLYWPLLV